MATQPATIRSENPKFYTLYGQGIKLRSLTPLLVQTLLVYLTVREAVIYSRFLADTFFAEPEFRLGVLALMAVLVLRPMRFHLAPYVVWGGLLLGSHWAFLAAEAWLTRTDLHKPLVVAFEACLVLGAFALAAAYAHGTGRSCFRFVALPFLVFASVSATAAIFGWVAAHVWASGWSVPPELFPKEALQPGQQYTFPYGLSLVMMFESRASFLGFDFYRMGGWFQDQNVAVVTTFAAVFLWPAFVSRRWAIIGIAPLVGFLFLAHSVTGILLSLLVVIGFGVLSRRKAGAVIATAAAATLVAVLTMPGTIHDKVFDPYGSRVATVAHTVGNEGRGVAFGNNEPLQQGAVASGVFERHERWLVSSAAQWFHVGVVLAAAVVLTRRGQLLVAAAGVFSVGFTLKEYGALAFHGGVWFMLALMVVALVMSQGKRGGRESWQAS